MDLENPIDVAVVGAGPSGARAAYCLARQGARVALVDPSHPREKPCGGGVTGRALALVADAVDSRRIPSVVVRSVRFIDPLARASAAVPLGADALVVASRAQFDGELLMSAARAGARLFEARVIDIVREGGRFRIDTTIGSIRAQFVVGADGPNSLVRRRLSRPFDRQQLSIATGYFADGVTSDEIVIELVARPPGYMWSFPRPTHLAIGICAQAHAGVNAGALRTKVSDWIRVTGIANQSRLVQYSWPIPSLSRHDFGTLTLAGPGWCLVGNAAGLVDPLTREGIYFSLLSGQWAADALCRRPQSIAHYQQRVHDEIGVELSRAAELKAGFFNPRFTRLLIDALQQSEAIRRVMADLVAGRQAYTRLEWRLLKTLDMGLAWKLFKSHITRVHRHVHRET